MSLASSLPATITAFAQESFYSVIWAGSPSNIVSPNPCSAKSSLYSTAIGAIGILCLVLLVIIYYKIFSKYCTHCDLGLRRSRSRVDFGQTFLFDDQEGLRACCSGLNENVIKTIPVYQFKQEDGQFEGKECAVCLSAFEEDESLRLLPKCNHAFHLPCIDMWLQSHANCPLCRANIIDLERFFLPAMAPPFPFLEDRVSVPRVVISGGSMLERNGTLSRQLPRETLERSSSSNQRMGTPVEAGEGRREGERDETETEIRIVQERQPKIQEERAPRTTPFAVGLQGLKEELGGQTSGRKQGGLPLFSRSASAGALRGGFVLDVLGSRFRENSEFPANDILAAETSPWSYLKGSRSMRRGMATKWALSSSQGISVPGRWPLPAMFDRTASPGKPVSYHWEFSYRENPQDTANCTAGESSFDLRLGQDVDDTVSPSKHLYVKTPSNLKRSFSLGKSCAGRQWPFETI